MIAEDNILYSMRNNIILKVEPRPSGFLASRKTHWNLPFEHAILDTRLKDYARVHRGLYFW